MSPAGNADASWQFARRVDDLTESAIFTIKAKADALASDGMDIVHLDAGEPDFDTPGWIIDAAKAALDDGFTHYTPVGGLSGLKKAIRHKLVRDNNLYYDDDEVMHSCGAKQALFNAAMTLLGPGDEILIPSPHWGTYGSIATVAGATTVNAPTHKDQGFILSAETLDNCLTDKTRAVVINSPNNPTGQVYSREALSALGNVLLDYPNVVVLADKQFGEWLIEELWLAMVPGSAFDAPGHMRISFAADSDTLAKALARLQDAFA